MVFAILLSLPFLVLARAAQQNRRLVVTGHAGEVQVIDVGGRSYVEIETLARVINGSLRSEGDSLVLTLPPTHQESPVPTSGVNQPIASGLSKDFLKAALEEMADVREWRSTLTNAIQRGFPVTPEWVDPYSLRAQQSLGFASLATSNDSDRAAFQLLTTVFNNMKQLSDRFLQQNKSRTYISPDSLNNDPLDQRILKCARSLAAMAASGQFTDDGSCH